jgi:hypothetical protein
VAAVALDDVVVTARRLLSPRTEGAPSTSHDAKPAIDIRSPVQRTEPYARSARSRAEP